MYHGAVNAARVLFKESVGSLLLAIRSEDYRFFIQAGRLLDLHQAIGCRPIFKE
jgi:hypothetical protein